MAASIRVPGFQGMPSLLSSARDPLNSGRDVDSGSSTRVSDLEDYFTEASDIEKGKDSDSPAEDDESKTPDEGEQEAAWLHDAGFGHLVSKFTEGKEIKEDVLDNETSSLTRAQAAAVKKRVDTLNATVRKKHKSTGKTDVRDVFSSQGDVSYQPDGGPMTDLASQGGGSRDQGKSGAKTGRDMTFIKGRHSGEYSMSGTRNVPESTGSTGVEMLSIQSKPRAGGMVIHVPGQSPNSSVSDAADISLNFALDDGQSPRSSPHHSQQVPASPAPDGSGLPNFVLVKDPLGITRVNDLGKSDLAKLRILALIELTSLFDTNNITYTRRKAKRRLKEHGVYGVPLQTLVENDQKKYPGIKVPRIFQELILFLEKNGIQEEGILRVPGSVTRIKALRQEIEDKFNSGHFKWEDIRPNDAAGLLKQFLREQPIPLLTFEYFDAFAQVESISDRSQQLQALTLLVLLLPDVHRDTLRMLLKFLRHVIDHEENKMTMNNVAMIMAPNLFLVPSSKRKIKDIEIRMAAGTSSIVKMLLKYQDILWTVPAFMINQIRHQYEADQFRKPRDKSIMKFLQRKDKSEVYKKPTILSESDFQEGVIRVQAPHLTKFHTAVQLDPNTTAQDIVNKFRIKNMGNAPPADIHNGRRGKEPKESKKKSKDVGVFAKENTYLYEVGGNIGERRLDHDTKVLTLLQINPNAEWVIKNQAD